MKKKYVKVMFNLTSGVSDFVYKIDDVNYTGFWNPKGQTPIEMGGFNFSTEDKILRFLVRGDTIYNVIIPDGAEIVKCESESCPNGVFRTNKIIINNPTSVTDEVAMYYYSKSNLLDKAYYKAIAGCAIRGHINTAKKIIEDKINAQNVDLALKEFDFFLTPNFYWNVEGKKEDISMVREMLTDIKKKV